MSERWQGKRELIVSHAMDLFREQGFRPTTMQQIADVCGISKGALYLQFASKQELVKAIFQRLSDVMLNEVASIRADQTLNARQRFEKHICYQFDEMKNQQAFTEMLLYDSGFAIDEDTMLMARKLHAEWQGVFESFVLDLYGEHIRSSLADLTVVVIGTINELYSQMLLHGVAVDAQASASFLFELTDLLLSQFLVDREPLIEVARIPTAADLQAKIDSQLTEKALIQIDELSQCLDAADDEDAVVDERMTLELLREAIDGQPPNRTLIQALLANLRSRPSLQPARRELAYIYRVKLL